MKKITRDEVKNIYEYEKIRNQFRQGIIELKNERRVQVGDLISLVFENRETVLFQIQEMLRAERIVEEERIQEEIEIYNELIPGDGSLSATLLIEIQDQGRLREELIRFMGIDKGDTLFIRIEDRYTIPGIFEAGRSKEDKISAIHYVKFPFTPEQREAFIKGEEEVFITIDHPNYKETVRLSEGVRKSLSEDLCR